MAIDPLQGRCPHCGAEELKRGFQGLIQCGNTLCEQQDAVHRLLTDPELNNHLVKVTTRNRVTSEGPVPLFDWTIRHPLVERLNDDLFVCEIGLYLSAVRDGGEILKGGLYRVFDGVNGGWYMELVSP